METFKVILHTNGDDKCLRHVVKATPHRDCGADTQSDFSADCAEILQAY